MILSLRFQREPSGMWDGRFVRDTQFERVTDLQLSTVCQAANHARDRLSSLFGRELILDVFAPVLLQHGTGDVIFDGLYYVAAGGLCDAYIVFRQGDGQRLAAGAFGEASPDETHPLSALEERALERIANEVAELCTPLCGEIRSLRRGDRDRDPPAAVTYFEWRIAAPVGAVIGIGLSRDPGPALGAAIDRSALLGIAVEVQAEFGEARIDALEVARWCVGATVRLDTKIGAPTVLRIGSLEIARGDCGIRANSNAVAITSSLFQEAAR
jgi:flagellar motor switch/type III secretory pathway protein FliN